MSAQQAANEFVARYSIPKVLGTQFAILFGAVFPLVPHVQEKTHYTSFLYTSPLFGLVVASCAILALLFIAFLPVSWRAIRRCPAIEISGDHITVHSNRKKRAKLSEVVDVSSLFGNMLIELRGRKFTAPVILCEHPSLVLERLLAIQPTLTKQA